MRIYVIVLLCALSGCAKSGDQSPEPIDNNNFDRPQGVLTIQGNLVGKENTIYTLGCKNIGQPTPLVKYDSRLIAGAKFLSLYSTYSSSRINEALTGITANLVQTVNSVTPDRLISKYLIPQSTNMPEWPSGSEFSTDCAITGESVNCDYTPKPFMFPELNCIVDTSKRSGGAESNLYSGSYTFHNGKTVSVTVNTTKTSGTVICNGQTIGQGSSYATMIKSNDVQSTAANFCGGRSTYVSKKFVVNNQIVGSSVYELLDFQ